MWVPQKTDSRTKKKKERIRKQKKKYFLCLGKREPSAAIETEKYIPRILFHKGRYGQARHIVFPTLTAAFQSPIEEEGKDAMSDLSRAEVKTHANHFQTPKRKENEMQSFNFSNSLEMPDVRMKLKTK